MELVEPHRGLCGALGGLFSPQAFPPKSQGPGGIGSVVAEVVFGLGEFFLEARDELLPVFGRGLGLAEEILQFREAGDAVGVGLELISQVLGVDGFPFGDGACFLELRGEFAELLLEGFDHAERGDVPVQIWQRVGGIREALTVGGFIRKVACPEGIDLFHITDGDVEMDGGEESVTTPDMGGEPVGVFGEDVCVVAVFADLVAIRGLGPGPITVGLADFGMVA